jgi:hypothetical protein
MEFRVPREGEGCIMLWTCGDDTCAAGSCSTDFSASDDDTFTGATVLMAATSVSWLVDPWLVDPLDPAFFPALLFECRCISYSPTLSVPPIDAGLTPDSPGSSLWFTAAEKVEAAAILEEVKAAPAAVLEEVKAAPAAAESQPGERN